MHEHYIIDWQINDLAFLAYFAFIGHDGAYKNVVVRILQEIVQCAMNCIVLARLDFYRMNTHCCMVVYKIINLALLAVIIIEELVAMGAEFLGNNAFINRTEVDATNIIEHRTYVVVIERTCQQSHIVKIKF